MHKNSYDIVARIIKKNFHYRPNLKILDVGGKVPEKHATAALISYKPLLTHPKRWVYHGLDVEPGKNVDIVVKDPYHWKEVKDRSYDLVVAGQVLEHVEAPWLWVKEVERVCKVSGHCIIVAPFVWPKHRYPVDCYRYLPDGLLYLFTKLCNFRSIRCRLINDDCLFFGERVE